MFFIILGNEELRPLPVRRRLPRVLSGTRAALEIPAAAQRSKRYRAPLPDAAHAIAAEAILGETVGRSAQPWTGGRLYTIKTADFARCRELVGAPANHCCALDDVKN